MDLMKLKYFYIVAKYEHITKASELMHIAQPAITKSIKLLENDLGVPLFYRKGRNIKLTEYGELLKKRLDIVFPILDDIPSEIEQMKNENKHTVRLNVLAASNAVMQSVIKYKNKYPQVIFSLMQNSEKENCDIIITTGYCGETFNKSDVNAVRRAVVEEKIFLAVPKNSVYANRKAVWLEELKDEKFIKIAGSRPFSTICDKMCEKVGYKPQATFESDSPQAVQHIIGAEVGVGFWPEYSWGKIKSNDVVLVPILDKDCNRELIIELCDVASKSEHAEKFYIYFIESIKAKEKL